MGKMSTNDHHRRHDDETCEKNESKQPSFDQ